MILHLRRRRSPVLRRLTAFLFLLSAVAGAASADDDGLKVLQVVLTNGPTNNVGRIELILVGTHHFKDKAKEPRKEPIPLKLDWESTTPEWSAPEVELVGANDERLPCTVDEPAQAQAQAQAGAVKPRTFVISTTLPQPDVKVVVRIKRRTTAFPYSKKFVVESAAAGRPDLLESLKAKGIPAEGLLLLHRELRVENKTPVDWPGGADLTLKEGDSSVVVHRGTLDETAKGASRILRAHVDARLDFDTAFVDLALLAGAAAPIELPRAMRLANGALGLGERTALRQGDRIEFQVDPKIAPKVVPRNFPPGATLSADVPPAAAPPGPVDPQTGCAVDSGCGCAVDCGKARHVAYIPIGTDPRLVASVVEAGTEAPWLPLSVKDGKAQYLKAAAWTFCLVNHGEVDRTVQFFDSAPAAAAFSSEPGGKYVVGGGKTRKIGKDDPVQQFAVAPASLDLKDAKTADRLKSNLKRWLDRLDRCERLSSVLCLDPANRAAIDGGKLGTLIYDLVRALEPTPAVPRADAAMLEDAEAVARLRKVVQALESLRRQVEAAGRPEDQWLELLRIRTRLEFALTDLEKAERKAGLSQADYDWSTEGLDDLVLGHPFKDAVPIRGEAEFLPAEGVEELPADSSAPKAAPTPAGAPTPAPPAPRSDEQVPAVPAP